MSKFTSKLQFSNKHLKISQANSNILIAVSVTTAIVIFSLVAAQALVKQMNYQNKVIGLRSKASSQLSKNVKAATTLNESYKAFDTAPESVIGNSEKNSKIVLDALPSKYDFPALATSLQGMITGSGAKGSISGTDNEAQAEQDSANPSPVEIPIQVAANGSFGAVQKLIADAERSIRPIKINQVSLTGSDANMQLTFSAITYYQPEKKLELKQTVVSNGSTKTKTTTKTTTGSTAK
jgi:hypothetical protein